MASRAASKRGHRAPLLGDSGDISLLTERAAAPGGKIVLAVGSAAQVDCGFVLLCSSAGRRGYAGEGQAGGSMRAGNAVVLRGDNSAAADFGQGGAVALTAGAALGKEAPNRGGGGSVSISAGGAAALAGSVRAGGAVVCCAAKTRRRRARSR
jgi:hypothetical protein